MTSLATHLDEDVNDYLGQPFLDSIRDIAVRIKDPGFEEEAEWRLICTDYGHDSEIVDLYFRQSRLGIVPYVTLDFPMEALSSIRIGPGGHESEVATVRELLRRTGFDYDDVDVSMSTIPFR